MDETVEINEIIIRYLDGSAALEDKILLLQWLQQSDTNRDDFMHARNLWFSCNVVAGNELEVDIALEKLKNRILDKQERMNNSPILVARNKSQRLTRWVGAAAILLLMISVGYGLGTLNKQPSEELLVQSQLITAKGSKGRFILPDGSVVWLNSETKLTYPERFADHKREVVLEGEAYFEVATDAKKPFVIQVGDLDVEVLGTSFNVNNYSSNEFIQTALLSGSVKISGKSVDEPVYLKPNELFEFRKSDHTATVGNAKVGLYADWIKDRLVFDNDYLSDILISMEGRYSMDINCPPQFAATTRMSFTIRQETIEEVLKLMSFIAPIQYEVKDGKAYIEPK